MEMTWKGHSRMKTLILLVWYCISFIVSTSYGESVGGIIENQEVNELLDLKDEELESLLLKIKSDVNDDDVSSSTKTADDVISTMEEEDSMDTTIDVTTENDDTTDNVLSTKEEDEYKEEETIIIEEQEKNEHESDSFSHLNSKKMDDDSSSQDSNIDGIGDSEKETTLLNENYSNKAPPAATDIPDIEAESNHDYNLVIESDKEHLTIDENTTTNVDGIDHSMDEIPTELTENKTTDIVDKIEGQETNNLEMDTNKDTDKNEEMDQTIESEHLISITQTELMMDSDETKQEHTSSQDKEESITDTQKEATDGHTTKNIDDDTEIIEENDVLEKLEQELDSYQDEQTYNDGDDDQGSPIIEGNTPINDDTEEIDEKVEEVTQQIEELIDDTQIPQSDSTTQSHSHTDIPVFPNTNNSGEEMNEQVTNENVQIPKKEDVSIHPEETIDETPVQETDSANKKSNKVNEKIKDQRNEKPNGGTDTLMSNNLLKDRQEAAAKIMDQNVQFVQGLTDIDKFLEQVDPPDELDVGAAGSSIQDVLMSQGVQIIKTRVSKGVQYVRKKVIKPIKDRVASTLNRKQDIDEDNYSDNEDDENHTDDDDEEAVQNYTDDNVHDYGVVDDDDDDDDDDDEPGFALKLSIVKEALNITKISNGVLQLMEKNKGRLRKIQQIIRRVVHRMELLLDSLGFLNNDDDDDDYDDYGEDNNDQFDESNQRNGKASPAFESLNLDQMRRKVMEARGTHSTNDGNFPKRENILNGIGSTTGPVKEREISDELQNMLKSRYQAKMKEKEESKVETENES